MDPAAHARRPGYFVSIAIIGVLYFILGFFTWLNGSLIPFLKLACNLESDAQALLVTFAFYMSYFFLAIPSSFILRGTGFKNGMSLGLLVMAAGAMVFIPAALNRSFAMFLTGLFVQGMGMALMQTAVNPYVSVIGPIESAARRISVMGICNKLAGVLSPLILSAILLRGANEIQSRITATTSADETSALLQELSHRIIAPYVVLALILVIIAAMIRLSPLPDIEPEDDDRLLPDGRGARKSILQFPHLLLGAIAIFVYVGVEVMAGDVIPIYAKSIGMSVEQTGHLTSYTMIGMLAGYVIGIATIPRFIRQETALLGSAILGIVFAACALLTHGPTSILFIALLGLANALVWPAIFPLAIDGLGRFTKIGSALLIMGIAGGAVIPQLYAALKEVLDFKLAFFACTAPAYLYIAFYALRGHRIGRG